MMLIFDDFTIWHWDIIITNISTLSPTSNLVSSPLFCIRKSIYVPFILIVVSYVLLYKLISAILANLSICTLSNAEVIYQGSNQSFSSNRFYFIMCWIHFYTNILQSLLYLSVVKYTTFIFPYFVLFAIRLI